MKSMGTQRTRFGYYLAWIVVGLYGATGLALPEDQPVASDVVPLVAEERALSIAALEEFNALIGGWRGVGMPQRNSNKGSWIETAEWVWELKKDRVGIRYAVKDGKLLTQGLLSYNPESKQFVLDTTLPDDSQRRYTGTLNGSKLLLESEPDAHDKLHQVVITRLNEKRTLVLFQSREVREKQFTRVAEVGYTREGTKLAEEGLDGPECIVTGGKGTMSTVYKGKTYWFCCTGCRDAFNDDPEGIIADAAKKAEKKKQAKGKS